MMQFGALLSGIEEVDETSEDGLWFLHGPIDDEPDEMLPGLRAGSNETGVLDDWRRLRTH